MQYRKLGRTSLEVSEIGLGTEYLVKQSEEIIIETVESALNSGINYFDILMFYPHFLKALRQVITDNRDQMILAIHLGAGMKNGKHKKARSKKKARESFDMVKSELGIEFTDIGIVQYVGPREYDKIMAPNGLIKYVTELHESRLIKHLGISTHDPATALKAIESGLFDVLMTQFNLFSLHLPTRLELIRKCGEIGIGLVAIKPFAGGLLLAGDKTVKVPAYKSGGASREYFIPPESTSLKNLAFILSNPSISSVIPGVKSKEELQDNLHFYDASSQEKDFGSLLDYFSNEQI
jgi:predicted aldo/keto reductase-like oxidoreductase